MCCPNALLLICGQGDCPRDRLLCTSWAETDQNPGFPSRAAPSLPASTQVLQAAVGSVARTPARAACRCHSVGSAPVGQSWAVASSRGVF